MKKIYVDGLGLVDGHFSGVGQYILGILRGMDELLDDAKNKGQKVPEIYVIIPRDCVYKFKKFNFKHIGYKKYPLPFRYMAALWHRHWLPPIDLWCGRGTYLFPRFVDMPLLFSKHGGLVVFDLSYVLHTEYSDEGNAKFLAKEVKRSIKNTKTVIAISENARTELIDYYKLNSNKVVVATPAADQRFFYKRSPKEIEEVKLKYAIKGDYILALSNLEPRKNLEALVDVYCNLPKQKTENLSLLLVGVSGWKTDDLFEDIVKRVEAGYKIIRPSKYVSDKDKPAIISGAKMLVYPSHYEGFGMPPLEALACGVPVITANNSSLPEAVGDAATMVASKDRKALLKAVEYYLTNIDQLTAKATAAGPLQAEKFSWTKSAKVILDALGES